MNYIDIISLFILLTFAFAGYKKGFIKSFTLVLTWAVAIAIAFLYYKDGSYLLNKNFDIENVWLNPLSVFLLIISSYLFLSTIRYFSLKKLSLQINQHIVNKILGIFPGIVVGLLLSVLLAELCTASLSKQLADEASKSFFNKNFNKPNLFIEEELTKIFAPSIQEKVAAATEGEVGVNANFKSDFFTENSTIELQMLQLINEERKKVGLKSLVIDAKMHQAAYLHAADLFTRGYFSHNTPEGIDPFERIKKIGIKFKYAGENLAHSSSLLSAHQGLMNSPGHKANILNPFFGKVGIVVLDAGDKGLMFVQEFRD